MALFEGRLSDYFNFYTGELKFNSLSDEHTYIAIASTRRGYKLSKNQFEDALKSHPDINILYQGSAINWYYSHRNEQDTLENKKILHMYIFETKKCIKDTKPVPAAKPMEETQAATTSSTSKTVVNTALRADIAKRDKFGRFMKNQWA